MVKQKEELTNQVIIVQNTSRFSQEAFKANERLAKFENCQYKLKRYS